MPGQMRPPVPGEAPGMMMPQATQQAYDQHMMAAMAAQMAGPSGIQPVTAQPGSQPVAGAMLGSSSGVFHDAMRLEASDLIEVEANLVSKTGEIFLGRSQALDNSESSDAFGSHSGVEGGHSAAHRVTDQENL